jgi:hypothetical protein
MIFGLLVGVLMLLGGGVAFLGTLGSNSTVIHELLAAGLIGFGTLLITVSSGFSALLRELKMHRQATFNLAAIDQNTKEVAKFFNERDVKVEQ